MKKVGGHIQKDKRIKMREKIQGISKQMDLFEKPKKKLPNTARNNRRQIDIEDEDPIFFNTNVQHNSEDYAVNNPPENDAYFTSGIYFHK